MNEVDSIIIWSYIMVFFILKNEWSVIDSYEWPELQQNIILSLDPNLMYSGTIWVEKLCDGIEYPYFHAEPTKEELGWE
jgi:hypothetical protein